MHVVAAAFPEPEAAQAAVDELRAQLDLEPSDIAVAPAGGDPSRNGFRALMVGRFRQHRRQLVEAVVRTHRGLVLDDLPERRLRLTR